MEWGNISYDVPTTATTELTLGKATNICVSYPIKHFLQIDCDVKVKIEKFDVHLSFSSSRLLINFIYPEKSKCD